MSYCGEVEEDDWCRFHACMRNMCRWQHEETFEQLQRRRRAARIIQEYDRLSLSDPAKETA